MKVYIREGHDVKCIKPTFWQRLQAKIGKIIQPRIIGEITADNLYNKFKKLGVQNVLLSDEKYKLTDVESIRKFLELDNTDKPKYVPIWHDCPEIDLPLELAWTYGLFFADGSCNIYTKSDGEYSWDVYQWEIGNTDITLLKRAKGALKDYFGNHFKIYSFNSDKEGTRKGNARLMKKFYRLRFVAGKKGGRGIKGLKSIFVRIFREMFYSPFGEKKVPYDILGSTSDVMQYFLSGVYAGDGEKTNRQKSNVVGFRGKKYKLNRKRISVNSRLGLFGLAKICAKLNYRFNFYKQRGTNNWRLAYNPNRRVDYGIGCDDFSFRLMGAFHVKPWSSLAFGIAWSHTHAFNIFYDGKKFWLIEPQNDSIIDAEKAGREYKPLEIVMM